MRLFLVRHGLTEWNETGRYQGQLDVPLSAEGRLQIAALRDRLRAEVFTACLASALLRALESAEILLEGHRCPIRQTPDLNEMSYGQWEGLTRAQIRERFPEAWALFLADRASHAPPGGESQCALGLRVQHTLDTLQREYGSSDASVLLVAHGGSIRAAIASLLNVPDIDVRRLRIDNASLSIVEVYGRDAILSLFNDTAHLGWGKGPPERQPVH